MRALVVCTGGGIGDVLLATPCMRALRQRYSEVVALTTPPHRAVLAENPDLAAVFVECRSFSETRSVVARERFDAAVVTWATPRSAALPFFARIPVRVGQSRRLYSPLFTHRVTVRSELGDHETHWTQILLDYARALDCDTAHAIPTFVVDDASIAAAAALLREFGIAGDYAVLHPTRGIASRAAERWPAASLASLATALHAEFGLPIVVTGSEADHDVTSAVAAQGRGAVSVAGRTTIGAFGALAQGARFVVAMDSGPMHVAAAVGVPTVGIFALRSDEPQRWRPLGPRVAVVHGTYPCPAWHRKETCPDFACVRALDDRAVVSAVLRLLTAASGEDGTVAERRQDAPGHRDDPAPRG